MIDASIDLIKVFNVHLSSTLVFLCFEAFSCIYRVLLLAVLEDVEVQSAFRYNEDDPIECLGVHLG